MNVRIFVALWPAFFAAGAIEMVVFALVDPTELHGLGGALLGWPRQAVYTVAFFVFWAIVAAACLTTGLLNAPADQINTPERRPWTQR